MMLQVSDVQCEIIALTQDVTKLIASTSWEWIIYIHKLIESCTALLSGIYLGTEESVKVESFCNPR